MKSPEYLAHAARDRVVNACRFLRCHASTAEEAWREYWGAGEALAYVMRCEIVPADECMVLLEGMDAALEDGLNRMRRKKSSPTGKAANFRKNAA